VTPPRMSPRRLLLLMVLKICKTVHLYQRITILKVRRIFYYYLYSIPAAVGAVV
jgi:hypothetical protein